MLDQENEVSPFVIPQEDVEVLNASEGFCMLRSYLARDTRYVARAAGRRGPKHDGMVGRQQRLSLTPQQLLCGARGLRCTYQGNMDPAARLVARARDAGA